MKRSWIEKRNTYKYYKYNTALHKFIVNDVGECLLCGKQYEKVKCKHSNKTRSNLSVHHINKIKDDNRECNITVLCDMCHHEKVHTNIRNFSNKVVCQLNNILNFKTYEQFLIERSKRNVN